MRGLDLVFSTMEKQEENKNTPDNVLKELSELISKINDIHSVLIPSTSDEYYLEEKDDKNQEKGEENKEKIEERKED